MKEYKSPPPETIKKTLNGVSPSFCLAKWTQVTIHLHNGTSHSCHHPKPHRIDIGEIQKNPAALHNTSYKISQREKMLSGEKIPECNYCWRVEDLPEDNISDRLIKSGYSWSWPQIEKIKMRPLSENFVPRYVEVNLGAKCNFKCSYCSPEVSSRWLSEIKQHGPYPTSGKIHDLNSIIQPIGDDEENPYLEAFGKWWPDLYPQLHTFRITGGEPLLNPNFYKILDWIIENPRPDLILGVNTNLCPSDEMWERFVNQMKKISDSNCVQRLEIYTSAEAWGEKSEYIRYGMDFELWRERIWSIIASVPNVRVSLMSTYNSLSVTSFQMLLEEVLRIKRHEPFYSKNRSIPLLLDISYLRYPEHQTLKVLPNSFEIYLEQQVQFMKNNPEGMNSKGQFRRGFLDFETKKMERILSWFSSKSDDLNETYRHQTLRKDFYKFFAEHDRRRRTDFKKTFPELSDFFTECEKATV